MRLLYDIAISVYHFLIKLSSLKSDKAKKWINGRKDIFVRLEEEITPNQRICWFHAASFGEFEQGRSLIEAVKKSHPEYKILLTFFSPSGYEMKKDYEHADYIFYLPLDTRKNAKRFIEIVNPEKVFFIKYEFWYHYLVTLLKSNIPTYIFSSIFRPSQIFFKPWGKWYLKALRSFTHFYVQNKESYNLLKGKGFNNVTIAGDTRIDRVGQVADSSPKLEKLESFCQGEKIVVAGSTWKTDEDIITGYINNTDIPIKFVIAPHEISDQKLKRIGDLLNKPYAFYSTATDAELKKAKVLIVDGIGYLRSIYRYANMAYIGGGFGNGIHNTLEPATFGMPILFGPNYAKFQEAHDLIAKGAAFSISNYEMFKKRADSFLLNKELLKTTSDISHKYVEDNRGATELILKHAFEN
jgi:3-deoxy-D-manno-octulosonic-acid transferase